MPSKFLSTKLGTDWQPDKSISTKVIETLLFFVRNANPGYDSRMHLIDRWIIEFDENGVPEREVGVSMSGEIVVAAPSSRGYGFWCDGNMKYSDFIGEEVSAIEFEKFWSMSEAFRTSDA